MKYHYVFYFMGGPSTSIDTDEDIDFHTLANTAIAFDDMYINMKNVLYIRKYERG